MENKKKKQLVTHVDSSSSDVKLFSSSQQQQQDVNQQFNLVTKQFQNMNIDIYGTYEEPLFKGPDIARILQIGNIRDKTKDFNERYKLVGKTTTSRGIQSTTFYTAKGVYRLAFMSKTESAQTFQDWVMDMIEEVRLTGQYKLKSYNLQLKQENQKLIEYNQKQKQYIITFDPEKYQNNIFIFGLKEQNIDIYYVGEEQGVQSRSQNELQKIYKIPCIDEELCEMVISNILRKQKYYHKEDELSSGSFYKCDLDYILLLSKYVCNTVNVLFQCRQTIQEKELMEKIQVEFEKQITCVDQKYNEEEQVSNVETQQEDQETNTDSFEEWMQKHLKNKKQRYILCKDIREKYVEYSKQDFGKINFNKYIYDFIKKNKQLYPDVIYKRIQINNRQTSINGQGLQNCIYVP